MNIQLYSVFHKPFFVPAHGMVVPLHAGKALAKEPLQMIGDDTGDNISSLNPAFCELTALYWIWKNADRSKTDAWGLCHYRRYFTAQQPLLSFGKKSIISCDISQQAIDEQVNDRLFSKLEALLQRNDVVVQRPKYISKRKGVIKTLEQHYTEDHLPEHWRIVKETILELFPDHEESLQRFCKLERMSFFNMMVARWELWDHYLDWLFRIMFRLQERIVLPEDPYQSRALGFISERLMNLYLLHHRSRAGYLPVAVFEK